MLPLMHPVLDLLFLGSVIIIWGMIIYQLVLTLAGYRYRYRTVQEHERLLGIDQQPAPVSIMIPARNEEVVTFFRDNGKTAVTLRVHATKGLMRFYAVDGGDFFKAVPADSNPKDDPQVIFTPGPGFYMVPTAPFPASMRCAACPRA